MENCRDMNSIKAYRHQRTVATPVSCRGCGVHSGRDVRLTIKPAPINHGIKFRRVDLPGCPEISAHFNMVVDTSLATVLGYDGFIVSTVEHIMAAFSGLSIDNALVEIDAYELPIMDGSAGPFTSMIKIAGIREQQGPKCVFIVKKPIELREKNRFVGIYPSSSFKITCTIDFDHPLIQRQSLAVEIDDDSFEKKICRARTFGFFHEVEYLKRYGFARGGSLENAVVIGPKSILNKGGLRFPDEFVRHKILDSIGDFSLIGLPIIGHVVMEKSGHAFNHLFIQKFFEEKESWDTVTFEEFHMNFDSASQALAN